MGVFVCVCVFECVIACSRHTDTHTYCTLCHRGATVSDSRLSGHISLDFVICSFSWQTHRPTHTQIPTQTLSLMCSIHTQTQRLHFMPGRGVVLCFMLSVCGYAVLLVCEYILHSRTVFYVCSDRQSFATP